MKDINILEIYNNFQDPVCVFAQDGKIIFRNKIFENTFSNFNSFEKFKKDLILISACYLLIILRILLR